LSFAGKGLKLDNADDAEEIVNAIKSSQDLYSLELKGNTLGVEASKALGEALEQHPTFKRALWSDLFTGRLKTEIPDALKYLCSGMMKAGACLVELDLSDNAFGPNGMIGLTDFLKSSSCYTLRELRLNNNGLGITGGKMLAESLQSCYDSSVKAGTPLALEVFVSGRGRLEDEGATALAQAFKAMKSLIEVHMPQNGINAAGITALADSFSVNTNLRHINLSDNTFTEKGSISMAKALPSLKQLEVINFDDCLVRTSGAKALANALTNNNPELQVLRLSGNEIAKDGAKAVVGAVTTKHNLKTLDLNCNQLGENGIENIKRILQSANKIEALQSLSDDEGSEDEDENEEDEDEEESDEDKKDTTVIRQEKSADVGLDTIGQALGSISMSTKSTKMEEFMASPSINKLQQIEANIDDEINIYVGNSFDRPEITIPLFMKICEVISVDQSESNNVVFNAADCVLSRSFSCAQLDMTTSVLCNHILVHLGLIKSEDKRFQPTSSVDKAFIVLEHCVQEKYFPQSCKDTLAFFLQQQQTKTIPSSQRQQLLLALKL
jgi:Ran GTPase-activating protein 1